MVCKVLSFELSGRCAHEFYISPLTALSLKSGRGCRDQASENNIQLNFTTRQEAIDALEKHLPSHLVKRARERGAINSERSEHLNSILKTAVSDVWL
jgi:hypothetical protein